LEYLLTVSGLEFLYINFIFKNSRKIRQRQLLISKTYVKYYPPKMIFKISLKIKF